MTVQIGVSSSSSSREAASGWALPLPGVALLEGLTQHPKILVGALVLFPVVALALLAPLLPIPGFLETNPAASFTAPSPEHPFGTDKLGRDILSRTLAGARISLVVGFSVAVIAVTLGVLIGTLSVFSGALVDTTIMTAVDVLLSFPSLLLAIALVAMLGAGLGQVVVAIVIADVPRAVRLQRSLALGLKSRAYIDAARMVSAPTWWLLARHVVPNTIAPMLVVASVYAANAILVEASLSFLGLGIVPPQPSWGNVIREGQRYLLDAWWISTFPGLALLTVTVGLHLIADGVRASLDPSLRV